MKVCSLPVNDLSMSYQGFIKFGGLARLNMAGLSLISAWFVTNQERGTFALSGIGRSIMRG